MVIKVVPSSVRKPLNKDSRGYIIQSHLSWRDKSSDSVSNGQFYVTRQFVARIVVEHCKVLI